MRKRDAVQNVLVVEVGHGEIFHARETEINQYALHERLVVIHCSHATGLIQPEVNAKSGHHVEELGAFEREPKNFRVVKGRPLPAKFGEDRLDSENTSGCLHVRSNVKVTGTLWQGAARCLISNGAVRPRAATWELAEV